MNQTVQCLQRDLDDSYGAKNSQGFILWPSWQSGAAWEDRDQAPKKLRQGLLGWNTEAPLFSSSQITDLLHGHLPLLPGHVGVNTDSFQASGQS